MEASGLSRDPAFQKRLGSVLAAMKRHVKGRHDSQVVPLGQLATEAGEPEGFLFNIIDSKSSSTGNARTGADWFPDARGRLVLIPVDFNLEPVDIAAALSVQHLERIDELEAQLAEAEQDRAQFHCPHCDARLAGIGHQDYPEHHWIVTYESFDCGYVTGDGHEEHPCPYGPNWLTLDEFTFEATPQEKLWTCYPKAMTPRARRVNVQQSVGRTKEETETYARNSVAPRKKGELRGPRICSIGWAESRQQPSAIK